MRVAPGAKSVFIGNRKKNVKQTVILYTTAHTEQVMSLPYLADWKTCELMARRRFGGNITLLRITHKVNGETVLVKEAE